MRAEVGRQAVPRRGPSEKRARENAVADQARRQRLSMPSQPIAAVPLDGYRYVE